MMPNLRLFPLVLLAACAQAAQTPGAAPAAAPMAMQATTLTPGAYHSTIVQGDVPASAPADLRTGIVGDWVITVHGPTHAVVSYNGREVVQAPLSLQGSEIRFEDDSGDYACHSPARYTWALSGHTLRFTKLEDSCQGREVVLTSHAWTMQ
jgi:hypothetical protein